MLSTAWVQVSSSSATFCSKCRVTCFSKGSARKTITRIMVIWGLVSAGMAFVNAPWLFYILRFFLGVFEAGFFPGIILYFTYWYPGAYRARIIAIFMSGIAVAGALGGPISGWIMNDMAGVW